MENIENYINTMIFIVIAKGVTIGLLLLLLFKFGQDFSYIVVTVQLGILAIAIWAIVIVVKYNRRMKKLKEEMNKRQSSMDTCPIYFKRFVNSEDVVMCENSSTLGDQSTKFEFSSRPSINLTQTLKDRKTTDVLCDADFSSYPWAEFKGKCNK